MLPRQRKRKMSAYRQMKEAARAKKERGFVGVRNRIPEEEFQLMLKGTDRQNMSFPKLWPFSIDLKICHFILMF